MDRAPRTSSARDIRRAAVAALTIVLAGVASAQTTAADTPRCINTINKGMRKVALTVGKELRGCIVAEAGGLLGAQTVAQCIAASPKVQKASAGALIAA